ncbi:MAG TPA: CheR family methyltransferase [Candidatus Sulfotelmatobacter sp.]|nr:CheR family methyltransferase [Candidatus Sulfotelmatobacter sp.]
MKRFDHRDVEHLRRIVGSRLGLQVEDDKLDALAEIFYRRLQARSKMDTASYLGMLDSRVNAREELRILASQLTVAETYFFRGPEHFSALRSIAIPDRLRAMESRRELRILSAGCASGEEAYSVAIVLQEELPQACPTKVVVKGIDINPIMLARAKRAEYSVWALRETSEQMQRKYFQARSDSYRLDARICAMVNFEEANLAVQDGADWDRADYYDVIFCRNVLMYLVPEAALQAVARLTRALVPGGYLFLSHAETLRGMSQDFHLRHSCDAFYYQRRTADRASEAEPLPAKAFEASAEIDAAWVQAVRRASEHIENLSRDTTRHLEPAVAMAAVEDRSHGRASTQLGFALDLLNREKYREALDALDRLPAESIRDGDAQLLRAVVLTNSGQTSAAESVCGQVLAADELNASAHYLLALCREHAKDIPQATEHDEAAIYLDPAFSLPHLHLGLLAKRAGDLARARRELSEADALLRKEDASRILLLGGGFNRKALMEFTEAQLRACGGTS